MLLYWVWGWALKVQHLGTVFFLGGGKVIGEAKLCLLGRNIPKILEYCNNKDLEQGVKTISRTKQYHAPEYITLVIGGGGVSEDKLILIPGMQWELPRP